MEEMKMVIKRGVKNGKFNDANTVKYSNVSLQTVVDMLDDIASRIEQGLTHMGTEVKAITVQGWTEIVKGADTVRSMADYYRQYMEG